MDNSEAIGGESVAQPTPASGTRDATPGVTAVTLGWLLLTLVWSTAPMSGLAIDPWASVRVTAMHVAFLLGVATPIIALLVLVTYVSAKASRRARSTQPRPAHETVAPGVVTLIALAWLIVSLLLRSEPGLEFTTGMLWLAFTVALGLAWVGILVPDAYRAWRGSGLTKTAMMVDYLFPVPLAAIALFVIIPGQAPLNARFEHSEAALTRYAEEFERTGGESVSVGQFVGLYNVGTPYRRDGCLILPTQAGLDYLAGFAYCTGSLPDKPNVDMTHIKGLWWTYEINH